MVLLIWCCLGGHSSIGGHKQTLETFWLVESNPEAESEGGVEQPTDCGPGRHRPVGAAADPGSPRGTMGAAAVSHRPKTLVGSRYLSAPLQAVLRLRSLLPPARKPSPGKVCPSVYRPEDEVTLLSVLVCSLGPSRLSSGPPLAALLQPEPREGGRS